MQHLLINMKAVRLVALFLTCTIISCGPSANETATKKLETAQHHFDSKDYNQAKLVLDTILENFRELDVVYTRAKELMKQTSIAEQQQNITFLDSLLALKEAQLMPLMANFTPELTEGLPTMLVHKRHKTNNSFNRSFIKPNLDDKGNFFISSQYCGASPIEHSQIKVSSNGIEVTTEPIEYDDFYNRRFSDAANHWEMIQFKDGKDNGVVDFIAQNADKTIRAQFIGKHNASILLETFDKEAIRDSYEISFILKEIARVKQEKANAEKILSQLQ